MSLRFFFSEKPHKILNVIESPKSYEKKRCLETTLKNNCKNLLDSISCASYYSLCRASFNSPNRDLPS